MDKQLRIALFADSFLEVDGAAMTCRRLVDYARRKCLPMICFYAGPKTEVVDDGSITLVSLKRSSLAIPMDRDLAYDPIFQRHSGLVRTELERFRADVFHITGLNDVSIIGAILGWRMQVPLLGSWHTNLHEFAAQRLRTTFGTGFIADVAERWIFAGASYYYRMPKVILAPNEELVEQLGNASGRTARLMARGVDNERFSPAKRTARDTVFRFGFVGRLQPEKNVRLLVDIDRALYKSGHSGYRFLIVGEGSEREYLEKNLRSVDFTGFIDGEVLSEAYANMDAFIFPSETDAFGNVVQEAMASGVPAIVSHRGGPKFLVDEGLNGYVAGDLQTFISRSKELLENPSRLPEMRMAARSAMLARSWDAIFDGVYDGYIETFNLGVEAASKSSRKKTESYEQELDTINGVIRRLLRHPLKHVLFRWNWKSALLSALLRSPIFFTVYLAQKQGIAIAIGAMAVQFVFRTLFGGVNGAILQSFSRVTPAWHAAVTVPLVLAVTSHMVEYLLQFGYDAYTGTKAKSGAITVSIAVSIVSGFFNLFVMRRGVLLVSDTRSQSLWRDVKQMPRLAFEFLLFPIIWTWRKTKNAA